MRCAAIMFSSQRAQSDLYMQDCVCWIESYVCIFCILYSLQCTLYQSMCSESQSDALSLILTSMYKGSLPSTASATETWFLT